MRRFVRGAVSAASTAGKERARWFTNGSSAKNAGWSRSIRRRRRTLRSSLCPARTGSTGCLRAATPFWRGFPARPGCGCRPAPARSGATGNTETESGAAAKRCSFAAARFLSFFKRSKNRPQSADGGFPGSRSRQFRSDGAWPAMRQLRRASSH